MATVTVGGNVANLAGKELNVGDAAPVVEVVARDLSVIKVGGASDKIQIIASVPSLDTPVCETETMKFNQSIAGKTNVTLTVISMDLPFAAERFCSANNVENVKVASDFRNKEFANAYGVLINDGALQGLTARAIFVVDKDGTIIYKEIVKEVTTEPNYEALAAAMGEKGCSASGCSV
ncbi:MAG: thiol peroxidase [Campylobacteraceae bacterium]|nr:thiol peroxidase [Campylobacteraceae bacterium]